MVRNNYNEPNKATFVGWVDEALDMALPKETSKMGFKLQEFGLWFQRIQMEGLSLVNFPMLIRMTTYQMRTMQKILMEQ